MNNKTIYDLIYIGIKTVILVIATSIIVVFTRGITYVLIIHIFYNFIKHNYSLSLEIFNDFNWRTIVAELSIALLTIIVIYAYVLNKIMLEGIFREVLLGFNLIILIQIAAFNLYFFGYLSRLRSLKKAIIQSLLIVNLKIGLNLLMIVILVTIVILSAIVTRGMILLIPTVYMFFWAYIGLKLFNKKEIEVNNE